MVAKCKCPPARSRRADAGIRMVFPTEGPNRDRARKIFSSLATHTLDAAFTPSELSFPLVIRFGVSANIDPDHGPTPVAKMVGGSTDYVPDSSKPPVPGLPDDLSKSYEFVDISSKAMWSDYVLIHEVVHALRFEQRRKVASEIRDEIETELETVARVPFGTLFRVEQHYERHHHVPGYYDFLGKNEMQAIWHDRQLLTGDVRYEIIGPQAAARVQTVFAATKLSALAGRASWRRSEPLWMAI